MKKQIGTFQVKDSAGKIFCLYKFADFAQSQTSSGLVSLPGIPWIETSDGKRVERIEKGHYKIQGIPPPIMPDIELFSDDPEAP